LKFEELKKKLKETIKPTYLIFGSDLFLKQKAEELIKEAVIEDNSELNLLTFTTDKIDPIKVIDACNTLPFFANKKMVIVKEYEKKSSDAFIKKLEEYVSTPNESTCLVLVADANSNYFEPLKKFAEVVDCNPLKRELIERIIEAELKQKNKTIDLIARELLIDYCSSDMSRITMELKKLVQQMEDENKISVEHIKNNVSKDLEFEIYELTGALSQKNAKEAYAMVQKLLEDKNTVSSLFQIIYKHFRRMFYIALNETMSNKDLAEQLQVKEYAVKKTAELVKNFSVTKLKNINELCSELDYKVKTGKLNAEEALYFFVLSIINM
jgi:DNA polymerase-3 subunit delta